MARIRTFKPELFKNEDLAEMGYAALILFMGLWQHCDAAGRCEDRPRRLKAEIFPYQDEDVDAILNALEARGFIVRYTADGIRYLWVKTFRDHQRITGDEYTKGSSIPPAPGDEGGPKKPTPNNRPQPPKPTEPTEDEGAKHSRNTSETPEKPSVVLEGNGKEEPELKDLESRGTSPSGEDSPPSGLTSEQEAERVRVWEFWKAAGDSTDPIVKALCKVAYRHPRMRLAAPDSLAAVERVVSRLREKAPCDEAILDEIQSFEIYYSAQKVKGAGHWWLMFSNWAGKCFGKWKLAKQRGGLMVVDGGVRAQPTPEEKRAQDAAQNDALAAESRRVASRRDAL